MLCRNDRAVSLRRILASLVFSLLFFALLHAQSGLTRGSLTGNITDKSGAAVSNARITINSPDSATTRTVASEPEGTFTFANLPSGGYTVSVQAPGFASYRNSSVVIAVGRVSHLDVYLIPSGASQQVTVSAESASLDTTQSSPVTNIDRDRIEELPIPSRNYLNFTLLSPALTSANPALAMFSPSATESGFSSGGLRPSSNALYIDGADDDDEYTGQSRTELSPEAISDFQVVNHGYAAESGGAAGGAVDVETRSGAALQHGDAFLFVQNGALNGTPALEMVPRKPDENRLRAGVSTGGEAKRGKLFYYVAGEQEMAHGEEAGDFSPQLAAQIDSALAQTGPLPAFRVQQGFFPTTNQETELSGRADRAIGRNGFMLRYALTNNRSVNDAFNTDDLSDLSARGSAFYNDNSLNGSWSSTLTSRLFHQMTFELAQRRVALRTSSTASPGIVVAGIAQVGTPDLGNTRRYETHVDIGDDLMEQKGRHLLQAGVSLSHVALRAADPDGFAGLYVFSDLEALATGQPDFYMQSFGDSDTNFSEIRSAAYVQDHWIPTRSLALDYGLRYEDNHLPRQFSQNAFDFSPRVGFAWSRGKDWVVRGGFGTFFDRYVLSTINRVEEFDGRHAEQQYIEGSAAAVLYQTGAWFASPHAGIAPSIWQAQPSMKNPYAETASFGVERALPAQWTVSAEYRLVHGVHMGRTVNSNLPPPVLLTAGNASSLGIPSPTPQEIGRPVFPEQRSNPAFDAINQFQTESDSSYNGLTLTVNRQFTEEFELMAGYTFSKTIDDASFDSDQPQNPYDLSAERALSLDNQRHRFVLSGLWVLGPDLDDPQDLAKTSTPNPFLKAVYGLEFAPILAVHSGYLSNPITGTDSNREAVYPYEARPLGLSRDSLSTPPAVNFDLRILRMVPIWRGHLDIVAESFNLLNKQNVDQIDPVFGSATDRAASFEQPIQNADARRIQFSLDYEY